jgi:hypothetical protein
MPTSTPTPAAEVVKLPSVEELDSFLEPFRGMPEPALRIASALRKIGEQDDLDEDDRAQYVFPEVSYEEIGRLYYFLRNARSLMSETTDYLDELEHWLWFAEPLDSRVSFPHCPTDLPPHR